jgi:pyridoxal phosphate enzyme (YggS family)
VSRAEELAAALRVTEDRLRRAAERAGRRREELTLVAVSKTWPAGDVALLRDLGVGDFGENRDQEARGKAVAVPDVRWHFVGRLQRNKCRSVAGYAALIHSLDRPELVPPLERGAHAAERVLDVLIQVSLNGDPARGGVPPAGLAALADLVAAADRLRLRGLMAVAVPDWPAREQFARLRGYAERLRRTYPASDVVSAGMSADLEEAVAEGATHLRVGTALFGRRPPVA